MIYYYRRPPAEDLEFEEFDPLDERLDELLDELLEEDLLGAL
jgi:hypothetical protein